MPAAPPPARLAACALGVLLAAAAAGQPPDPPKLGPRQPDGTFAPPPAPGEKVVLSPDDHAKLLAQIEQLKKQLAARKPAPPGGCAVRGRVEKRGDAVVAALKLTVTFRTAAAGTAVAVGGKRAFLVAAALDGGPAPPLEPGDDGLVAWVEAAGDHTLTLDVECPVGPRANKAEVGFELGLPRAVITTLALEPPPGVGRVSLGTRTPDAKAADVRRGVDAKQLAPPPGRDGYPLGPVESVEVGWEPPAAAPPADPAIAADWDIVAAVGDGGLDTTAKLRGRGAARTWAVAVPAAAAVTADRVAPAAADAGPAAPPTVTKTGDPDRPVWQVVFPPGAAPAEWVVTAVVRPPLPKDGAAKPAGPFPVGPFALLDAARQTGTLKVTAAPHTRLAVRHGPELRQDVPPGPAGDDAVAFFRLAGGPVGAAPPAAPLAEVEARATTGQVEVRPTYRLTLTDAGWRVRADLKVVPVRRELTTLMIDLPADWRAAAVTPPEVVDGVEPGKDDGPRRPLAVRLAPQKQPFDLVLTATVPVPAGASAAAVLLPRFPGATERDATVTAAVADGFEVRGAAREWDGDQPAGWGQPLAAVADPKGAKGPPAVGGRSDAGFARVDLSWSPHRAELTAEVRAEVTVQAGQVVVAETLRLRAPDGFGKGVRVHGPAGLKGLKASPPLDPAGPGEWAAAFPPDAKEATLTVTYALPVRGAAVPVGLLWPVAATRVESVARVWNGAADRAVAVDAGAWRELPAEPAAGRDVLPVRTLAGSGADLPLGLALAAPADATGGTAAVVRGLVQVWLGDDGTAAARGRFLLSSWVGDSLEVVLPPAPPGAAPEVEVDGKRAEAAAGPRGLRVPLPEGKPGRTLTLDVRYRFAAGAWQPVPVPELAGAAVGPVRLRVTAPRGVVPLVAGGQPYQRWAAYGGVVAPFAPSEPELEAWFLGGTEPAGGGGELNAAAARADGPVRLAAVPLAGFAAGCSAVALVVGLLAVRLPGGAAGPAVAGLAGAVGVAAVLVPQPAAAAAAAALPGAAAFVLAVAARAGLKRAARRRVTHLPGFARGRPPADDAPTARPRPGPAGSTGALDPAPG